MSLFKFAHRVNEVHSSEPSVFYLNEQRQVVLPEQANRFIVKQRTGDSWREFYGVVRDINAPEPEIQLGHRVLSEADQNLYHEYHLDQELYLTPEHKKIPMYIPENFLDVTPLNFAGVTRTLDKIAKNAVSNREFIHDYFQKNFIPHFLAAIQEMKCTSVAELYSYCNNGAKWQEGQESVFIDGLFEVGGFLSVTLDTTQFSMHTACHESWHAISYFLIDELFNEYYDLVVSKQEDPITEYAMTECSEDIAEAGGFYFGDTKGRANLKKKCPLRFAFMQKVESMGAHALVDNLKPTTQLTTRFKKYDRVVY